MAKNKKTDKCASSAPIILRVVAGLVLFVPGLMKLWSLITTGSHGVTGSLWGSVALAWALAIIEVVAGGFVIAGYKQGPAAMALMVILVGAIVLTSAWTNLENLLWHLLGIAALYQVYVACPCRCSSKK